MIDDFLGTSHNQSIGDKPKEHFIAIFHPNINLWVKTKSLTKKNMGEERRQSQQSRPHPFIWLIIFVDIHFCMHFDIPFINFN